jgi:hypothetical protein
VPKSLARTPHRGGFAHVLSRETSRRSFGRAATVAAVAISVPSLSGPLVLAPARAATHVTQTAPDTYDLGAATTWLLGQQSPDGGFPGPSGASDVETTIDAVMLETRISARTGPAHDYLLAHGPVYAASGPGQAARLALAAIALLEDPTAFGGTETDTALEDPPCVEIYDGGGVDLMTPIAAWFTAQTESEVPEWLVDDVEVARAAMAAQAPGMIPGLVGRDLHDHAYALLALSAYPLFDIPDPETAIELFQSTQAANGGWAVVGAADPNAADARTTALVIQALVYWERIEAPIVQRGLAFLRSLQTPDGGFAFDATEPRVADSASTAMAMQALLTTDEDPTSANWGNVPRALARFQLPSGGFRLLMSDDEPNLPATLQAMLALSNRYLPVRYYCSSLR